jgi:16S rRNA (cytosine967-C5)-methyltransferase
MAALLTKQADVVLRTTPLKPISKHCRKTTCGRDSALTDERFPDALCEERANVFQTQMFQEGLFEVQDAGILNPHLI